MLLSLQKFKKYDNTPPTVEQYEPVFQSNSSKSAWENDQEEQKIAQNDVSQNNKGFNIESMKNVHIQVISFKGEITFLSVRPNLSIRDLKAKIEEKEERSLKDQQFRFQGKKLYDYDHLNEYNIGDGAVLFLTLSSPRACFLPDAPITLSNGLTKRIKDLKDGDLILTYNTQKLVLESYKISNLSVFKTNYLCEIEMGNQKVISTPQIIHYGYLTRKNGKSYGHIRTVISSH